MELKDLINDYDENKIIREPELVKQVLDLCVSKNFSFTEESKLFVVNEILYDVDILIYFINKCQYDDYIIGLITSFFDESDNEVLFRINNNINNEYLKDFLVDTLNFDNYDVNTIVDHQKFYLMVSSKEDTINLLKKIKEKGLELNIILIMDRVDINFIDEACNTYSGNIRISPIDNQIHKEKFEGPWDFPDYTVDEIKESEKTLDLYAKTVLDKVDKDGDIKSLSPLEKFVAAYILATKFSRYHEEEKDLEAHVSRGVYDVIKQAFLKDDDRRVVCVGFVNLLKELLYRMGLEDTITWSVHNPNGELGDNHERLMIHLVDPKYGIDGIYMVDPTWDTKGLHRLSFKHILMSQEETMDIDPEFTAEDLHFDELDDLKEELKVDNVEELFNRPIPKDTIVVAYLAVIHFLDKNLKMTDDYTDQEYYDAAMKLGYPELIDFDYYEDVYKDTLENEGEKLK